MDAGLLANACIVSTAVRSTSKGNARMESYANGSGKSMAECCGMTDRAQISLLRVARRYVL